MKHKTIDDIALEAGVSKATVSRVISHPEIVSKRTQERVRAVMDKYSYTPSLLAQGLAGSPTKTIGVIIDELSNFFFIEIAEGIDRVLSPSGYSMLLSSSRWIEEREIQLVRSLISNRVQGVLIAPISENSFAIRLLQEAGIPFVVINSVPKDPSISYVCCDNHEGGHIAAQYLNTYPSEQIIVITGFAHQSIEHRLEGFYNTIKSPESIIRYSQVKTQEEGYLLAPDLIKKNHIDRIKTTLFITNDNVAIGIINRLVEEGIRIPDQVSILGYDNIRISELCRIPLTTINQSITKTGELAAQSLLKLLKKQDSVYHHSIHPSLIQRESTAQIPQ
jgi:DNA-binding LacI/PurR family transcriptional regulator